MNKISYKKEVDKMFGIKELRSEQIWSSENEPEYWLPDSQKLNAYTYRSYASERVAVPKDYINRWESGYKCEREGCFKDGSVECHVSSESELDNREVTEHLCCDHAFKAGYCICCGEFWGGIESFDFNNPSMLCENCQEDIDCENGDEGTEYYPEEVYHDAIDKRGC